MDHLRPPTPHDAGPPSGTPLPAGTSWTRELLFVGGAAGLASALLMISGSQGAAGLAAILFLLTPLPMLLAGLGWGWRASAIAALSGLLAAFFTFGPRLALIFALSQAVPAACVCWLAFQRGTGRTGAGDNTTQHRAELAPLDPRHPEAWSAPGVIITALALMAGALATASMAAIGGDLESLATAARAALRAHFKDPGGLGSSGITSEQLDAMIPLFVRILPAMTAASWLLMMLANLWLSGRILMASGRLARPWPDLAALRLPPMLGIALAVALLLTLVPGLTGIAAQGFASAIAVAYALVGLAVLHTITRGNAYRPFALSVAYLAALVFAPYGTGLVAIVGLLDGPMRLRARYGGSKPGHS